VKTLLDPNLDFTPLDQLGDVFGLLLHLTGVIGEEPNQLLIFPPNGEKAQFYSGWKNFPSRNLLEGLKKGLV